MRKKICSFILGLFGWKGVLGVEIPKKSVFCVAPHTSNWDFIIGELFYSAVGGDQKVSFLIKKEWFTFPLGYFFRWIGGVPVDRGKRTSLVQQMVAEFHKREKFCLAVTPEGTRKANPNWKLGFYRIAKEAGVPIVLVYMDYSKKIAGAERLFEVTGDEEADIAEIKKYYSQFTACHPENFVI